MFPQSVLLFVAEVNLDCVCDLCTFADKNVTFILASRNRQSNTSVIIVALAFMVAK